MKKTSLLLSILLFAVFLSSCREETVIDSAAALAQVRVGAVEGTAGAVYAQKCGSEFVSLYPDTDSAAAALLSGEIDCIVSDLYRARETVNSFDGITTTEEKIIEELEFCAAVRADDFDTLAAAEVVTAEASKDTGFTKLCRGFSENLGAERDAFITAPQTGQSGTLVLGTCADYPPYAYEASDGSVAGISIELAKRFAAKRDLTIEIKVYDSNSELTRALKNGDIDLYFAQLPVSAAGNIKYSSVCYSFELRVLIPGRS